MVKIKRALISVYDKTNLAEFVKGLKELGIEIISTGGTAEFIKSQGIEVKNISDMTGFPEILDGRVKTLHPKVHGALLSLRESHAHMAETRSHGIEMIDMVVVNLYPFQEVVAKPNISRIEVLENIDIGGVSLLRSAAKNYSSVAVICKPSQYNMVLDEMKSRRGVVSDDTLSALAAKAFEATAGYDKAINNYFNEKVSPIKSEAVITPPAAEVVKPVPVPTPEPPKPEIVKSVSTPEAVTTPVSAPIPEKTSSSFPEIFNINLKKVQDLRYGENPHQKAAFYKEENINESCIPSAKQLCGKELSYNNIMDMDTALAIVKEFDKPAGVIVKHANPCGVAVADTLTKAYTDAHECDKMSAFGGIIGLNRTVDISTAEAILASGFLECVIAPGYDSVALDKMKAKQNLRILQASPFEQKKDLTKHSIREVAGGLLLQSRDLDSLDRTQLHIVTKKKPVAEEVDSLLFAWKVIKYIKSNAIVLVKDTKTIGIGAGQMSRVDSVFIATQKASRASRGSVLASDAFFPKADGIETAARAGVTAIIQPGGSKADDEIIRVADRRNLSMVFTGMRHFRH